jgi:putative ABC transport system ATP-binding protein
MDSVLKLTTQQPSEIEQEAAKVLSPETLPAPEAAQDTAPEAAQDTATEVAQDAAPKAAQDTAPEAAQEVVKESDPEKKRKVVIDVQDVVKKLPLGREHIEIIKGISFQIFSGELVCIVGPSGSGKSTLLGIIAGLDNPTTGKVLIDGIDITKMSEGKLAKVRNSKIGMVFQAFNLIPTLTAQENVEIPLYVGKHKGSPAKRAQELLALVGLSHRLNHRPNQLSGGEQQRIALARALATDPALVIADEPTGNLDARNSENVLKLITELREATGKTFIIATHDPVVASHADRALRIVDGQLAELDHSRGVITQ